MLHVHTTNIIPSEIELCERFTPSVFLVVAKAKPICSIQRASKRGEEQLPTRVVIHARCVPIKVFALVKQTLDRRAPANDIDAFPSIGPSASCWVEELMLQVSDCASIHVVTDLHAQYQQTSIHCVKTATRQLGWMIDQGFTPDPRNMFTVVWSHR